MESYSGRIRRSMIGKKSKNISIVDKGLSAEGTFTTPGKLIVKGTIKGKLKCEEVIIAQEGAVYAVAEVGRITIAGKFDGEVSAAEELMILPTGKCSGKVTCRDLVVEAGGKLNAEVNCIASRDLKSGERGSNTDKKGEPISD